MINIHSANTVRQAARQLRESLITIAHEFGKIEADALNIIEAAGDVTTEATHQGQSPWDVGVGGPVETPVQDSEPTEPEPEPVEKTPEPTEPEPAPEQHDQAETTEEPQPEPEYALTDVRAKLATLIQAGHQDQVATIIADAGAEKLSAIDPTKFPQVMAAADEITRQADKAVA